MAQTVAQKREDAMGKVAGEIEAICYGGLDDLATELEEKRDNMEPHFSDTARFEKIEEAASEARDACQTLEELAGTLSGIDFNW